MAAFTPGGGWNPLPAMTISHSVVVRRLHFRSALGPKKKMVDGRGGVHVNADLLGRDARHGGGNHDGGHYYLAAGCSNHTAHLSARRPVIHPRTTCLLRLTRQDTTVTENIFMGESRSGAARAALNHACGFSRRGGDPTEGLAWVQAEGGVGSSALCSLRPAPQAVFLRRYLGDLPKRSQPNVGFGRVGPKCMAFRMAQG